MKPSATGFGGDNKSGDIKKRSQEEVNMDTLSRKGRGNTVRRPPEANTPAFSGATARGHDGKHAETGPPAPGAGAGLHRAFTSDLKNRSEDELPFDVTRSRSMD